MSVPLRLLCISVLCLFVACRGSKPQQKEIARTVAPLTVGFYNVENLFDTKDNPDKIDEDFTPEGKYKWTEDVYAKKRANIAKAIASMGPNGPDLLGLAEVENARVVQDLLETEPLKGRNYAFLHAETPDMRGIDNAFVYDADKFKEVSLEAVEVDFPEEPDYTSRKILVVSGKWNGHPLHIMVNHWPSRWGGAEASEPRRFRAATVAREAIDRLLQANPEADIILMGDLNDDPFDRSVTEVIRAQQSAAKLAQDALFNATYALHNPDDSGTLTYKGKWNLFDQLLLSKGLLDGQAPVRYRAQSATIHNPEFMQVGGNGPAKDMPRRAIYRGEFQAEGYSDHFPVYMVLEF